MDTKLKVYKKYRLIFFWDFAPCILVEMDRRFDRAYYLHHQGLMQAAFHPFLLPFPIFLIILFILFACFFRSFTSYFSNLLVNFPSHISFSSPFFAPSPPFLHRFLLFRSLSQSTVFAFRVSSSSPFSVPPFSILFSFSSLSFIRSVLCFLLFSLYYFLFSFSHPLLPLPLPLFFSVSFLLLPFRSATLCTLFSRPEGLPSLQNVSLRLLRSSPCATSYTQLYHPFIHLFPVLLCFEHVFFPHVFVPHRLNFVSTCNIP